MSKISIRFYDDREVRAVWDDVESKCWFSVLDMKLSLTVTVSMKNPGPAERGQVSL